MCSNERMKQYIHRASVRFFCYTIFLILGSCCPHRYLPKSEPDPLPAFYLPDPIRVALVLGSGGVRGMAHVGVLEELEAAGIPIDIIVGCSVGSMVGALYANNPNIDAIKHAVWSIRSESILDINLWECRYGLSQGRNLQKVIDKYLNADTFEDLKIPLVVVASDLYSGELVPIGSGDLEKAVKASCSIPFVFVPCEHQGRILVDGGVVNPVPVKVAADLGANIIIAVDLCELLPKTFPTNLFQIANRSAEIAFMWQNEICTHDADIVIRPKTCGVGTFNDHGKWQIYEAGRRAAREQIPHIQKLIDSISKEDWQNSRFRLFQPRSYAPQIHLEKDEENPEGS